MNNLQWVGLIALVVFILILVPVGTSYLSGTQISIKNFGCQITSDVRNMINGIFIKGVIRGVSDFFGLTQISSAVPLM
ncbi:MAG: hypothetical protein PHS81_01705, partial [Candidatus Nanoarchaeia archaeon]|nr:hypothetical protein [Candidatus Nanoarchaeia archaeon]